MNKYIFIPTVLILIASCFLNFKFYMNKDQKALYIDNTYVYTNFKMTKELENELAENKNRKQNELDSLVEFINLSKNTKSAGEQQLLEKEFILKRNKLVDEQEKLKEAFNTRIWERLNTYIKEFGVKHNYSLILGANGQGNIMHATDELNLSEEFIDYANTKYNGK